MEARRGAVAACVLSVAVILLATLPPVDGGVPIWNSQWVGRGSFRLADAVRNLLLFVPLGASLAYGRVRPAWAVSIGALLSALIETSQIAIPGRHANPVDLFANTVGTGVGLAIARTAPRWLRPPEESASVLARAAGIAVPTLFLLTGLAFEPASSRSALACHLPPDFAQSRPYDGAILSASIDGLGLSTGPLGDSEHLWARLRGGYDLRVAAIATPPAEYTRALLVITDATREVLFLGVEDEDLVFRHLTQGGRLGLEPAHLRLQGALRGAATGEAMEIRAWHAGEQLCLAVDDTRDCGLGPTVGDGWSLLVPQVRRDRVRRILAVLWVASLFVPLGYWGVASRRPGVPWATAGAGLLLAPVATGMLATPFSQLVGAAAGLAVGAGLWRIRTRGGAASAPGG